MASLFGFKKILHVDRSSRLEVFCIRGVLQTFAKFTGKNLYGSLFFDKVAACKPATLSRKKIDKFVFRWIFKEHLFYRTSANGCFCATGSIFGFLKNSLLTFFHQGWSLTFFNYSEVDVMKSNEACIVLKSSITIPLVLKHKFMFAN